MTDPGLADWLAGLTPHGAPRRITWGGGAGLLSLNIYATPAEPPDALVSSVRGVLFKRRSVMLVRDPGGQHVVPGGRREEGEDQLATLARELAQETGWRYADPRRFGFLHFHHETPKPDGYAYPYPDFFQPLFVLEATDYDRRRVVRDAWELSSRMTPIERARALLRGRGEHAEVFELALAARGR